MLSRRLSALVLTTIACSVAAQAQTSQTTGAIKGTLTSKKGGQVKGASLLLRNLETGFSKTVVSDASGNYAFSYLPVGTYELTATASGLRTAKDNRVRVTLGQTTTQNFSMDAAEASTVVEVFATTSTVDSAQVSNVTAINQEMVEAVPLNGRNFTDLVLLTPGTASNSQGYRTSVEGARGVMNNLQIDGASFNSKFVTEQRGGTRVPFSFGADTIRELQVITNGYDAQYGDAAGAIINAVTKGGTNELTMSGMIQIRPESMVAKLRDVPADPTGAINTPENQKRKFSQWQGNFNIGGPIIKDKLFFFVGAETYHYQQDNTPIFTYSSKNAGSGQTEFNAFTAGLGKTLVVGNGGATLMDQANQTWTNDIKNTVAFARFDWYINADHRLYLRVNSQDYSGDNNTYPQQRKTNVAVSNNSHLDNTSVSTVAELSSNLSANLTNEARIQVSTERRKNIPNSTASPEVSIGGVTFGQYYIDPRNTNEDVKQLIDNLTYVTGDWTLKTGINMQWVTMDNTFIKNSTGGMSFGTFNIANEWARGAQGDYTLKGGKSDIVGSTYWNQSYSPLGGHLKFDAKMFAGYVNGQYNGLFNRRLMLSLGVRFSKESFDGNPNPNPVLAGLDAYPDTHATDPRFGFSFDVFGNAKTVVRGGYGHFSIGNPGQSVSGAIMNNGLNMVSYNPSLKSTSSAAVMNAFKTGVLSYGQRVVNGSLTPVPLATLQSDPLFVGSSIVTPIDPNTKMAQARRSSIGVEQDLGDGYKVGVTAKYAKFYNMQYSVNINMTQQSWNGTAWVNDSSFYNDGYATTTNHFSRTVRPGKAVVRGRTLDLSKFGDVFLSKADGEGEYKSLVIEASRTKEDGFGFQFSTTFSKSTDNNSNEVGTLDSAGTQTYNPADPLSCKGPSDNDVRLRTVLALYAPPVYGFRLSGITTYTTGRPYTAIDDSDLNGDSYVNDPAVGAGGRNRWRYPSQKTFDMRIARPFKLGKKAKLEGIVDVYNVFNWANFSTSKTKPGKSTIDKNTGAVSSFSPYTDFRDLNLADSKTREVQFSLKFTY